MQGSERAELRFHGDAFGDDADASALRETLALALARGFRCALDLTRSVGVASGVRSVPLCDGTATRAIRTNVDDATLAHLATVAATVVAPTAPVLVFGSADALAQASLQYGAATFVERIGAGVDVGATFARVLRTAPRRVARAAQPDAPAPDAPIGHVDDGDPVALALASETAAACGRALRRVHPDTVDADVCAWLQPWRHAPAAALVDRLLATGRPLILSHFAPIAERVDAPGCCVPIGGRHVADGDGARFEPDRRMLVPAVQRLLADPAAADAIGRRGRALAAQRATPAPFAEPAGDSRPVVVLEAPLFELDSTSVLTAATANALRRRGRVDLHLVAARPDLGRYEDFRRREPELVPHLAARPPAADLWLSAGWPPRVARPSATRRHAIRFDYEYGALPADLAPALTQEADHVVVHSRHVERLLVQAGTPPARIVRIPHGVDADVFTDDGARDAEIDAFAAGRCTFLFVGGPIWRKGFDVVVRGFVELCRERAAVADVCLVVKTGGRHRYHGFELATLLDRCERVLPPRSILRLDDDIDAARMAAVYRTGDALVHPYRGEGFCLPILEARACGLPVVATAGGAADDVLGTEDGVDAWLPVPATPRAIELRDVHVGHPWILEPDPSAFAEALRDVVARRQDLTAAARAAAERIRSRHRWDAAAAAIERLAFAARTGPCRRVRDEVPTQDVGNFRR